MGIAHKKDKKLQLPFHCKMEVMVFVYLHLIVTSKTKMSKYETNDTKGMKSINHLDFKI